MQIGIAKEGSVMRGVEWVVKVGEAGGEGQIDEIREDGMGDIGSEDEGRESRRDDCELFDVH